MHQSQVLQRKELCATAGARYFRTLERVPGDSYQFERYAYSRDRDSCVCTYTRSTRQGEQFRVVADVFTNETLMMWYQTRDGKDGGDMLNRSINTLAKFGDRLVALGLPRD